MGFLASPITTLLGTIGLALIFGYMVISRFGTSGMACTDYQLGKLPEDAQRAFVNGVLGLFALGAFASAMFAMGWIIGRTH